MTKKTDCNIQTLIGKNCLTLENEKKKCKVVPEKYIKHHNLSVAANNRNILYNTAAAQILQSATAVERDLRGQVDYDSSSTTSGSEAEEIEQTIDSEQVIGEISGQDSSSDSSEENTSSSTFIGFTRLRSGRIVIDYRLRQKYF